MKWMPHDLGTWGFILSIVGIFLMYPVGLLINLTSPLVQDWIATSSKASLEKRIAKLEKRLVELEENPAIDEVQDHILWGIKSTKLGILAAENTLILVVYYATASLAPLPRSHSFTDFSLAATLIFVANLFQIFIMRYSHDFRSSRSPKNRAALRKSIEDLQQILSNWGRPSPVTK